MSNLILFGGLSINFRLIKKLLDILSNSFFIRFSYLHYLIFEGIIFYF